MAHTITHQLTDAQWEVINAMTRPAVIIAPTAPDATPDAALEVIDTAARSPHRVSIASDGTVTHFDSDTTTRRTGWWVYLREDDSLNHDNENQEPDNPFLVITDADDYAYLRCLEDQDDLRPDEPESVKRTHAVISYITETHGIDAHLIEDVVELKE